MRRATFPTSRRLVAIIGLMTVFSQVQAGSPGGLNILVIPSGAAQAHLAPVRDYLDRFASGGPGSDCGDSLLDLADVRFANALHRIPEDLGTAAITDAKQRKRLAKALASYRDKHLRRGFDGALVIDVKSDQVQLAGISADGTEKPYEAKLPLSALAKPGRLRQAMCKALARLPVLEEP